jgi:hypothetical protein
MLTTFRITSLDNGIVLFEWHCFLLFAFLVRPDKEPWGLWPIYSPMFPHLSLLLTLSCTAKDDRKLTANSRVFDNIAAVFGTSTTTESEMTFPTQAEPDWSFNSFPATTPWRVTAQRLAQDPSGIFDWTIVDWPKPAETPIPEPNTEVYQPFNGNVPPLASLISNQYPVFESLVGHLNRGGYDNLRAASHGLRAMLPNLGDPLIAKTRRLLKSGCQEPRLQYPEKDPRLHPHPNWEGFANTSLTCPQSNPQSTVKLIKCIQCAGNGKEHWFCQPCHSAARLALKKKFWGLENGCWEELCDKCVEHKLKTYPKEGTIYGNADERTCCCQHAFQELLADDQIKCLTCTASPFFQWYQKQLDKVEAMDAYRPGSGLGRACYNCHGSIRGDNWRRQGYKCVVCNNFSCAPAPEDKLDWLFKGLSFPNKGLLRQSNRSLCCTLTPGMKSPKKNPLTKTRKTPKKGNALPFSPEGVSYLR